MKTVLAISSILIVVVIVILLPKRGVPNNEPPRVGVRHIPAPTPTPSPTGNILDANTQMPPTFIIPKDLQ
jgi:hypothetical protein